MFEPIDPSIVAAITATWCVVIRTKSVSIGQGGTYRYKYAGKVTGLVDTIEVNGVSFKLQKTSVGGNYPGVSVYYRNGNTLLRISDHWSGIEGCGIIRESEWTLTDKVESVGRYKLRGGIASL